MNKFLIPIILCLFLLVAPVYALSFKDYRGKDVEDSAGLAVLRQGDKYYATADFTSRKGAATFKLRFYPNDGNEGFTVTAGQFKPAGDFSTGVLDLRDLPQGAYLASLEVMFADGNTASLEKSVAVLAGGSGWSVSGYAFSLPGSDGNGIDVGTAATIAVILVVLVGAALLLKRKPRKKGRKQR